MTACFLLGIAPFASGVFLAYLIGRRDGRCAEQRRRFNAANRQAALIRRPITRP